MSPEELRSLIAYLEGRVRLPDQTARRIAFDPPAEMEMIAAGLHPEGVRRVLAAPWWEEMVGEILDTPDYCSPEDPPEQLLRYARDVVGEYIRKRFTL